MVVINLLRERRCILESDSTKSFFGKRVFAQQSCRIWLLAITSTRVFLSEHFGTNHFREPPIISSQWPKIVSGFLTASSSSLAMRNNWKGVASKLSDVRTGVVVIPTRSGGKSQRRAQQFVKLWSGMKWFFVTSGSMRQPTTSTTSNFFASFCVCQFNVQWHSKTK